MMPIVPHAGVLFFPYSAPKMNRTEQRYRTMYEEIIFSGTRRFAVPLQARPTRAPPESGSPESDLSPANEKIVFTRRFDVSLQARRTPAPPESDPSPAKAEMTTAQFGSSLN